VTISSDTRQTSEFTGAGEIPAAQPFSFRLHDSTMLEVVIRTDGGAPVAADPGNYTVALNADQYVSPGGTVTYGLSLAANETLQIRSNLTFQQESDLTVSNTYNPRTVEDALDYLTMCIQDIARKAGV